jgi:hypothetical protein
MEITLDCHKNPWKWKKVVQCISSVEGKNNHQPSRYSQNIPQEWQWNKDSQDERKLRATELL